MPTAYFKNNLLAIAFATAIPFFLESAAHAQLIGIQTFSTNGTPASKALTSGQTAGVIPQANFNTIVAPSGTTINSTTQNPGTGSITNLVDSTGASTGIGFTLTGANNFESSTGTGDANHTLLSGQSGVFEAPATYSFTNVPFGLYDIVIYTVANQGIDADAQLTTGTTTGPSTLWDREQVGTSFSGTFIQSTATTKAAADAGSVANYIEFINVQPDSSGTIEITVPQITGSNNVGINGLQLLAVPEPSTMSLVFGGVVGLFFLMMRRRPTVDGRHLR